MDKIKLDFCILDNPIDKNKNPIIFITGQNKNYLDINVVNLEDYENVIFLVQKFGYIETDILTFEFSQDPDYPYIPKKNIKKILEEKGLKYNYNFEKTLKRDFNKFKDNSIFYSLKTKENKKKEPYDYFFNSLHNYYIPEIGEKITLYFYLFLECNFKKDKCYLNLNGNFFSNEETDTANYIKVVKSDFIRINNYYNPNKIILKSVKTNRDFLKEIPFIKHGKFKRIKNNVEKTYVYYFIEIKKSIADNSRIKIEIENNSNFDSMIELSKTIKKDYIKESKQLENKKTIIQTIDNCYEIINEKMLNFAKEEKYEDAGILKKDLHFINKKRNQILQVTENIPFYKITKKIGVQK